MGSSAPDISVKTVRLNDIELDIYGLERMGRCSTLTCLWLLHPRTYSRKQMNDFACRSLSSWMTQEAFRATQRGVVALAFDLPNHGSRLRSDLANQDWDNGNDHHARHLASTIHVGRSDLSGLIDQVEEKLFRDKTLDHIALGWSLGGHIVWEAWIFEPRIQAAVVIVGCPDILSLMEHRARTSGLDWSGPFYGSKHCRDSIIASCLRYDPKASIFGPAELITEVFHLEEQARLRLLLKSYLGGKSLLVCSGEADTLVPYSISQPFLTALKQFTTDEDSESGECVQVDDRLYKGVGHDFSSRMAEDSIVWIMKQINSRS